MFCLWETQLVGIRTHETESEAMEKVVRWLRSMPCVDSAFLLALARWLENTELGTLASAMRQSEGFKMMPTSAFMLEESPISPPDTPADTEISKWISFTYSLVSFQIAAFVLVSRVREKFQLPIALWVSWSWAPFCFPEQMFSGLISPLQVPRVTCLMWGTNPLLLRENLQMYELPPDYSSSCLGWSFGKTSSLPLLPVLVWPLYCLLWRNCSAVFQVVCGYRFSVCVCGRRWGQDLHTLPSWTAPVPFFPVVHYLLIFVFVWLCFLSLKRMIKYQISLTKWYQPWPFF